MKYANRPFSARVPGLGTVRYQTGEPVPTDHATLAPAGALSSKKPSTPASADADADTPTSK